MRQLNPGTLGELDAGGRSNVYLSSFPSGEGRRQVSTNADGSRPVWSHSGRELFYRLRGGGVAVVDVSTASQFEWGVPEELFRLDGVSKIDVFPDDSRFITLGPVARSESNPDLIVVQNFFEELERRVPRRR